MKRRDVNPRVQKERASSGRPSSVRSAITFCGRRVPKRHSPAIASKIEDDGYVFVCGACGQPLFTADSKFESHCGWPSFTLPKQRENVRLLDDSTALACTALRCGVKAAIRIWATFLTMVPAQKEPAIALIQPHSIFGRRSEPEGCE